MSNITPMFQNYGATQSLRDKGYGSADFNIHTTPLSYTCWINDGAGTNTLQSSKSVIYRTDTGEELGVHGHGYQAVSPKQMIDATRAILERSDLDITDIEERIRTSHNGSRCFVQYTLPAHDYKTPDGDTASLSLLATSSIDGTFPFMISAAAIQSACTNLQVFIGGEVAVYKSKHTKSLNIDHGANIIVKALDVFENQRDLWQQFQNQHVSSNEAFIEICKGVGSEKLIDELVDSTPDYVIANNKNKAKNAHYIWTKYQMYKMRLGDNRWALYNAFTDWSTHSQGYTKASQSNIASVLANRQDMVRKAFAKAA
jgi:hypothetical protein